MTSNAGPIFKTTLITALSLILTAVNPRAATYEVGETVEDFILTARYDFRLPDGRMVGAGSPVQLRDLAGTIVFLEWFAVWCTFCNAAAPQVIHGIADHYESRQGNPFGVPVVHILVNQESAPFYQARTDAFIQSHNARRVLNDYGAGSVRFRFQPTGQPVFAIINGVTQSPSHRPWELLVNHLGYGERDFTDELARFRMKIDSVQPAPIQLLLTAPVLLTGGSASFSVQAPAGKAVRVEYSSNLQSWSLLREITGSGNPVVVTDPTPSSDQRYYRAVIPG